MPKPLRTLNLALAGLVLLAFPFQEAAAAYVTWDCTVSQVQFVVTSTTGQPRVAVQCQAPAAGGIYWFAYRISDGPDLAKMILSMLSTAKVAGRTVRIGYESTNTSGGAWGCNTGDCRIIMKLEMY